MEYYTRRDFGKILVVGGLAGLVGCNGGGGGGKGKPIPIIESIARDFNEGNIEYTILVKNFYAIQTQYNNGDVEHHSSSPAFIEKRIVQKDNILNIVALGKRGVATAEDQFEIANKNELVNMIKGKLDADQRQGGFSRYEEPYMIVQLQGGEYREIFPEFLLVRSDGRFACILVGGLEDDLDRQINDQKVIQEAFINYASFLRVPKDVAERRIEQFIQDDYTTKF